MTRPIEFRVWDKDRKVMLRVSSITFSEGEVAAITCAVDHRTHFLPDAYFTPESVELMQATGLKDKNGREIFEGDIVFINHTFRNHPDDELQDNFITVRIELDNGAFWFRGGGFTDCNWHHYPEQDRTVLGNIHEHPELLEAK